jgi:hypothetical protein
VASEVVNPVYALTANSATGALDTNGVIIELPAVGATGAATVSGTLVFGIGTESNNALVSTATVLTTDPNYGSVSVLYNSTSLPDSYLDSGSNAIYYNPSTSSAITDCSTQSYGSGFLCTGGPDVSQTATIIGANNLQATADFSVGDATTLFTNYPSYAAFSNLAGSGGTTGSTSFAFGLPFFYGVKVYTAMENADAGGTTGPYFAF